MTAQPRTFELEVPRSKANFVNLLCPTDSVPSEPMAATFFLNEDAANGDMQLVGGIRYLLCMRRGFVVFRVVIDKENITGDHDEVLVKNKAFPVGDTDRFFIARSIGLYGSWAHAAIAQYAEDACKMTGPGPFVLLESRTEVRYWLREVRLVNGLSENNLIVGKKGEDVYDKKSYKMKALAYSDDPKELAAQMIWLALSSCPTCLEKVDKKTRHDCPIRNLAGHVIKSATIRNMVVEAIVFGYCDEIKRMIFQISGEIMGVNSRAVVVYEKKLDGTQYAMGACYTDTKGDWAPAIARPYEDYCFREIYRLLDSIKGQY